jgi:membrane protease YdiL (CAAX protease family)
MPFPSPPLCSVALVPLALVLGYVYYRSNSYLAAVIVHALFNALNVFISLAGSQQAPETAAIFRP